MSETKPNDIEKLREILFNALENLQDGKIDVPKAKAISDIRDAQMQALRKQMP